MTFLNLSLLAAGLACVAIPIVIHLLMHRRRKPVMWGAMRFLLEAYRRQRRRLMLEKWLLLAARCLVLACLALALGRPLLGALGGGGRQKSVYILIDNGLASSAQDDAGRSALDRHKAAARSVLDALGGAGGTSGEGDRVGLIAMGGPAEAVVMPASGDLASVGTLIDALEPTDSRTDVPGAISLVAASLGSPDNPDAAPAARPDQTFVVVLSDFLDGSADVGTDAAALGAVRLPAGVRVLVSEPGAAPGVNTSIVGMEPLRSVLVAEGRPDGAGTGSAAEMVRVLLRRSGEGVARAQASTVRARLAAVGEDPTPAPTTGDQTEGRVTVTWAPGQEQALAVVPVRVDRAADPRGGAGSAVLVASTDADAIAGDNAWRRPIELRQALRVGVVAPTRFGTERADRMDAGAWARLALAPAGEQGSVEVVDVEPASIDAARLAGLDAVVLPRPDLLADAAWARVKTFLDSGGLVIVTPPPALSVHLWGDGVARVLGGGAEWSIARETRETPDGKLVLAPGDAGPAGGAAPTGLFSVVEGELGELLSPVNVARAVPIEGAEAFGEVLLRLSDGAAVLWAGSTGAAEKAGGVQRGLLIYLGVALDLDWTDLPAKPLMVPLVQELLRQGVGRARGSWWTLAGSRPPAPGRAVELRPLEDPASARRDGATGDADRGVVGIDNAGTAAEPLRHAGVWRAVDERGAARGLVAVNADPRAGRAAAQPKDAVGAWLARALPGGEDENGEQAAQSLVWLPTTAEVAVGGGPAAGAGVREAVASLLGEAERGSPIDLPLLIAALAFAVAEVFLARWASHAEIIPSGLGAGPRAEAAA